MADTTQPPTPDGVPLLGNGLAFSRDPFGSLTRWADEGDVVRLNFPGQTQYMVTDPELIKQVLVERQDAFTIGREQRETFAGIEDDALTANTGERWRRLRRALQPAFTREGVWAYGDRMAERTAEHVAGWDDGDQIDLLDQHRLLTVRILGDTLLGVDVKGDEEVVHEAADALVELADVRRVGNVLPDWVPTPAQRRFDRAADALDRYVEEVLTEHSGEGDDACSVLLAANERGDLSWNEVRDNTVALLLAGHDSTAVTLTYAWYELSRNPEIRESLVTEVASVLDDDVPTVDSFDALERTRNVVRETLRLYPPTWTVGREATERVTLDGYTLPAGTQLLLPQWVLHRDDRFWDDPEAFDPSRWEREVDRPEYAYFPFSGGRRHCLGMRFARLELTLALATMVDRVALNVSLDGPLTFRPSLSLRPETAITAVVDRE